MKDPLFQSVSDLGNHNRIKIDIICWFKFPVAAVGKVKCDLKIKEKQVSTVFFFIYFTVISAMNRALKMKETGTLGMR